MKTLLVAVNAKYIHANPAVYSLQKSCQAYSRRYGIDVGEVVIKEFTINQSAETIYYEILAENADVVAFSVYIWNIGLVRRLCADLKAVRPQITIWLGGPEVSYGTGQKMLTMGGDSPEPAYDIVMEGEGERILFALLLERILAETQAAGQVFTPEQQEAARLLEVWQVKHEGRSAFCMPIEDLDELPFIYDDLTPFKNRILYYEASRGCPFQCAYCLSSAEKGVRELPLERVLQELGSLAKRGVAQVKLVDRTFNCHPQRAMAIIDWIAHLPETCSTNFHFEVEANLLSDALIDRLTMLPQGRVQLEIGIQSTNEATLRACGRSDRLDRVMYNIRRLVQAGNMNIHVDLIAGLPLENLERFAQSFNEVYALGAHQFQLGFLKLLTGTPMEAMVDAHAYVFSKQPPYEILRNRYLSERDLFELKCIEDALERVYNSGRFPRFLVELQKRYEAPFAMMRQMAAHFRRRGITFSAIGLPELCTELLALGDATCHQALLLDYYSATPSDRLPAALKTMAQAPEGQKDAGHALLRRLQRRERKMVIRYVNGRPVAADYTQRDPVTGRFPLWNEKAERI